MFFKTMIFINKYPQYNIFGAIVFCKGGYFLKMYKFSKNGGFLLILYFNSKFL